MYNQNLVFVDGFKIRNTLDTDFNVFHSHAIGINSYAPKFYIPEEETWVDHRFIDEVDFLIVTEKFFKEGNGSYEERRVRARTELTKKGVPPDFYRYREKKDDINICHIDGKIVREYIDPEFVFGGHDLVYSYIPKMEVWVDAKIEPEEIPFILHHELTERGHMAQGKTYEIAHEYATVAERELRRRNGVGFYPGDPNYAWKDLTHHEIILKHYIVGRPSLDRPIKVKHFIPSPTLCGPASLKIALTHFGKEVAEGELARLSHATIKNGTEHEGLVAAAKTLGASVISKEGGTVEDLEKIVTKEKLPVIIGWFDRDGDHYSVVIDMTPTHLVLSDPAWETPERYIDREMFPRIWFDFVGADNKTTSWGWYMVLYKVK